MLLIKSNEDNISECLKKMSSNFQCESEILAVLEICLFYPMNEWITIPLWLFNFKNEVQAPLIQKVLLK